jgi:isoquinoline 1-oxidoreductase
MKTMRASDGTGLVDAGRRQSPHRAATAFAGGLTRRRFLRTFAGGLAVLWLVDRGKLRAQAESGRGGRRGGGGRPRELAAWLHIAADGAVTVYSGKVEMGQNVRTMLTQAVAEELPTAFGSIKMVLGDTSLVPFDGGTAGSRSTPDMVPQIRRAAATAREALLDLAARQWRVERAALSAADGRISHAASQRSAGYGELTKGEKLVVEIADSVALKPATAWRVMGTSVPKVDGRSKVTGRHLYASDLTRPGCLHARVLRPPSYGASLVSLDASAAEALPGVVVARDVELVAALAPTEQLAAQAVAALRAEWKIDSQAPGRGGERDLFTHLRQTARNAPPPPPPPAPGELRQTYTVAYIAHTPLEPRAALAEWKDGRMTVWTGTQRPFGARSDVAAALKIPEDRVRVIVPDTGSGYGGKHIADAAVEAARLAKAAGRTVKLVWTREEEFTWAYFRPAGVIDIASTVGPDGRLTRWEHRNYNSGNAAIRALYDVADRTEVYHPAQSPLRQGSYRSLAGVANHFARETHIDEQAHAQKLDPLEFRLRNLKDPRARAVLEAAAQRFGWGTPAARTTGQGVGLAVGFDKAGYVATCIEIAVDRSSGRLRVVRVVEAFECGAIVNPNHLRNQIEGCIVQGLGGALFEAIRFDQGRILNPRLSQYRVPRFSDTPAIDIVLLDRKDLPSAGGGEAPNECVAPALGNAIFAATGVRLRSLPLAPNGLRVA